MTVALILLAALAIVGGALYLQHRFSTDNTSANGNMAPEEPKPIDDECCGLHAVCEKKTDFSEPITYYDDEELDSFRGRDPKSYDPDETEQFREVLLTLLPGDVEPWGRSLQRRGIELPETLRDEYIMMASDV